jgi:hypothetical protein
MKYPAGQVNPTLDTHYFEAGSKMNPKLHDEQDVALEHEAHYDGQSWH